MQDTNTIYPRAVAHIGVTVDDIDRAVSWYRGVLGLNLLSGPTTLRSDDSPVGRLCADCFPGSVELRVAHMSAGNGVGLELFEWKEPRSERVGKFEYWKNGLFHLAVVDPDLDGLVERIAHSGGRQRSRIWAVYAGRPYRFCYCEDPFGNTLEISSHSYETVHSNQGGS